MLRSRLLAGAAVALLGCHTGTSYTPRTPGRAALGMVNGEAAIYKDGRLFKVSVGGAMPVACSPAATSTAGLAAAHHADYRRNASLSGMGYALGVFFPPLYAVGGYFGARSMVAQQHAHAAGVDTINLHNDDAGCL